MLSVLMCSVVSVLYFFFSSRRRHTRCALVTGIQTCALPISPLEAIVRLAHEKGVPVLADGTQAVVHHAIDVSALDVDFYALTGHKLYGPTGIGALYAKPGWIERMSPMLGGGEMVATVGRNHVEIGRAHV